MRTSLAEGVRGYQRGRKESQSCCEMSNNEAEEKLKSRVESESIRKLKEEKVICSAVNCLK